MSIFRADRRALCGAVLLAGCAGPIERWIVNTRVHQGEVALARGDARDAELAYRLALRVDPNDAARAPGSSRPLQPGPAEYRKGDFDDALATVDERARGRSAERPAGGLKATIDQAKLKREIVISNYPTYRARVSEIQRAYQQLNATNALLLRDLRRFGYTFDTNELTAAIKRSYELQLEIAKNTNRLILFRQLVSSGVPEAPSQSTTFGAGSLLPLP